MSFLTQVSKRFFVIGTLFALLVTMLVTLNIQNAFSDQTCSIIKPASAESIYAADLLRPTSTSSESDSTTVIMIDPAKVALQPEIDVQPADLTITVGDQLPSFDCLFVSDMNVVLVSPICNAYGDAGQITSANKTGEYAIQCQRGIFQPGYLINFKPGILRIVNRDTTTPKIITSPEIIKSPDPTPSASQTSPATTIVEPNKNATSEVSPKPNESTNPTQTSSSNSNTTLVNNGTNAIVPLLDNNGTLTSVKFYPSPTILKLDITKVSTVTFKKNTPFSLQISKMPAESIVAPILIGPAGNSIFLPTVIANKNGIMKTEAFLITKPGKYQVLIRTADSKIVKLITINVK